MGPCKHVGMYGRNGTERGTNPIVEVGVKGLGRVIAANYNNCPQRSLLTQELVKLRLPISTTAKLKPR